MTKRMAYLALLAAGVLPGGAAQRAVIVIKVDKGQNVGRRSGAARIANSAEVEAHVGARRSRVKRAGRSEERGDGANTRALFMINPLNPP
jgi:hypothetical protein